MKRLTILSMLLLLATLSLSVKASDVLCSEDKGLVGGTIFYKSFLYDTQIKQAYTFFYQAVDDVLENNMKASCPKLSAKPTSKEIAKMETFLKGQHALCNNTCEVEAVDFHHGIGTKFFVGSKIKQLQRECKSICQAANDLDMEALRE